MVWLIATLSITLGDTCFKFLLFTFECQLKCLSIEIYTLNSLTHKFRFVKQTEIGFLCHIRILVREVEISVQIILIYIN